MFFKFLAFKIPLWVVFLLFAALGLKGCSDMSELRELAGSVLSLQAEIDKLTEDKRELATEAATLRIDNKNLGHARDGLLMQLSANNEACTKQLTDRERIAAIKAGDACVVQEIVIRRPQDVGCRETSEATESRSGVPQGGSPAEDRERSEPAGLNNGQSLACQACAQLSTGRADGAKIVDGETSDEVIVFFNDLFAAGVQP